MEFTKGARDLIEKNIRDIMGYMTLGRKDGADVEKVLRSGFYESTEAKAKERNSNTITEEDVKKALAEEGTPQEIAGEYMKSFVGNLKRVGFWRRSAAFILDLFILLFLLAIPISPFIAITLWADSVQHTPLIAILLIINNLIIGLIFLGVAVCYFVILEGRFGRSPGKYVLGIKVLKIDGMPIGYKEALLRNVPKFFGLINFTFIDALIMVIFFNKEKQRGFDKVADTIVVRTRD